MFCFLLLVFFGLSFDRLNVFKYCIISSMLHEAGHILVYRFFTGKWPDIEVGIFGFRMQNNVSLEKFYIEILSAGPLMNLFIVFIGLIVSEISFSLNAYVFSVINLYIFLFNLMPVYYLDGGQILYSISTFYQKNYYKISIFSLLFLCVMVYSFTGNYLSFMISVSYLLYNILIDV